MDKRRTSLIWQVEEQEFKNVIKSAHSYTHALSFFGLKNKGGNIKTLKNRIKELKLSTSHFLSRIEASNKTRTMDKQEFIDNCLIKNSKTSRGVIKKWLFYHQLIEEKCESCGLMGEWQGKPLTLQLEHKNGESNDNRLENLALLCPNCHSQTPTFAGRSSHKNKNGGGGRSRSDSTTFKELGAGQLHYSPKKCQCGKEISKKASACRNCAAQKRKHKYKINWPTPIRMRDWVWEEPTSKISEQLGVSDKAVEKFCKKYKIEKPPRGYWMKNKD